MEAVAVRVAELDGDALMRALESARSAGASLTSLVVDLLVPTHQQIEDRFARGNLDAPTRAAATSLLRRGLAQVASGSLDGLPGERRGAIGVVVPPGPDHLFVGEAIAEVLTAAGWVVDLLAGPFSGSELERHLQARQVRVAVVVCARTDALPTVVQMVRSSHAAGLPALATGSGFGPDDLRALRIGADGWAGDVSSVGVIIDRWIAEPPRHEDGHGFGPSHGDYERLERTRRQIEAAALSRPGSSADPVASELVKAVARELIAAVLVDDSRVLLASLDALVVRLEREQGRHDVLINAVDAVFDGVAEDQDRARQFLREGRAHIRRVPDSMSGTNVRRTVTSLMNGTTVAGPAGEALRQAVQRPAAVSGPLGAQPDLGSEGSSPSTRPFGDPGQAVRDLLLLGGMACHVPVALLSVPRPDGTWSTLSSGLARRDGLSDPSIFAAVANRHEPVELADLARSFPTCALVASPHEFRWAYGMPLRPALEGRDTPGPVIAVLVMLDRWQREIGNQERRALEAVGRQLLGHLFEVRRGQAGVVRAGSSVGPPVPGTFGGLGGGPSVDGADPAGQRGGSTPDGQLMRSHEVAQLFDVTERTVINWAASGKLPSLRTIGGHLRFRAVDVRRLLAERSGSIVN